MQYKPEAIVGLTTARPAREKYRTKCKHVACGGPLPAWYEKGKFTGAYGFHGDGLFCTARCGYQFGVLFARKTKST